MRRAVAGFVLALSLLLPVTPVGATFSGGDGLIYFIDSQSGQPTIVTVNSDGTPGSVGPFPGYVDVEVAPDGRTFLAIDPAGALWLVSPAGGRRPMSTGGNAVQGVGWAPDGERFLAVSEGATTDLLLIGNVDGRTPFSLGVPNIEASPATPVFSIDGSQIFYFSAAADVLPTRLDLATGATDPIQSDSGAELMPRASSLDVDPSGELILYGCTDNAAPRETIVFCARVRWWVSWRAGQHLRPGHPWAVRPGRHRTHRQPAE